MDRGLPTTGPASIEGDFAEQMAACFHRIAMQSRNGQDSGPRQERQLYDRVEAATAPDRGQYIYRLLQSGDIAAVLRHIMAVTIFDATPRRS